jgi:hypothetical protein
VVVWDWTAVDVLVFDEPVFEEPVFDDLVALDEVLDEVSSAFELTAAVCVVDARPSCHASRPPSESIEATLSAAAAFRARAARGLRPRGSVREGVGIGVRSSMPVTVRIGSERAARGG